MTPARVAWRRGIAWLVDASACAAIATVLAWPWLHGRMQASAQAFSALRDAVLARLQDAVMSGADSPLGAAAAMQSDPRVHALLQASVHRTTEATLVACFAYALVAAPWHLIGEASAWQGSPGKRLLGLRVVDARRGGRASPAQCALRFIAGGLSWLLLNLGHMMAALPPRYTALHDRIAGTQVVWRPSSVTSRSSRS